MNKQRICIIGDGLSGLMTTVVLGQIPEIEVNLIAKKGSKNLDKRTTAVSDMNFKFIKEHVPGLRREVFWPSQNIKLYYETTNEKINFLNLNETNSNLMYVFENDKIKKYFVERNKEKKN